MALATCRRRGRDNTSREGDTILVSDVRCAVLFRMAGACLAPREFLICVFLFATWLESFGREVSSVDAGRCSRRGRELESTCTEGTVDHVKVLVLLEGMWALE